MSEPAEVPSQSAANKVIRVLSGKPLKYTCRVHKPDGSVIEWQSDARIKLHYNDEARALWVAAGDYANEPIMAWEPGMILLAEENPV